MVARRAFMTQRAIDGPFVYFVTTNTASRVRLLHTPERAQILGKIIQRSCKETRFDLYGYSILPDHVHLLVRKTGTLTLSHLMKRIKGRFWRAMSGARVWQPRFNFRIVDNDLYLTNVVDYIVYNYRKMNLDEMYGRSPYIFIDWEALVK